MKIIKNISSKPLMHIFIIVFLSIVPYISHAQPDPGGDPDVPIDGGVSLLIAAGVGYGAKKLHEAKKEKKEADNNQI